MTPEQFRAWRKHNGLSQAAAAKALGLGLSTVKLYERGTRLEDGNTRQVVIPKPVRLAMAALSAMAVLSIGLRDHPDEGE